MTAQNKEEIRGLTLPMIRTFVACTVLICSSVIGAGVYIKSSFNDHERRITTLEASVKNNATKLDASDKDIISLQEWRKQVTAYYLPPTNKNDQ